MSKPTPNEPADKMATFSVRLWEGQLSRIHQAALRAKKSTPEWILDLLMPATAKVLGDTLPEFPPIKRRPERGRSKGIPGLPDSPQARKLANALASIADESMAQQVIAAWLQAGKPTSGTMRTVASTRRR